MLYRRGPLLIATLLLLALVIQAVPAQDQEAITGKLKYKGVQKWNIILPKEVWSTASGSIAIPHQGGDGFATNPDGMALMVDTTGDGRCNDKVKGVAGSLRLKGKDSEGKKFSYDVRFRKEGSSWQYACSGLISGRIGGELITIIDQNNNGCWNDYGTDAMIVGKSKAACYLSRVVNLKGKLYNFEVADSGKTMSITPYVGEVGSLDLRSGFKTYGQLVSAVVSSEGGDVSFDLAKAKKGMAVPAGKYVLSGGYAVKGSESARVRTGQMTPLEVKANEKADLAWGAPLRMEFDYTIQGETITVQPPPQNIKYFGAAGEEYYDWKPDATSPNITIVDAKTGREVGKGRFGGC
jgi:hypothetical protein